jgi:hypothetical protein
MAVPVPVDSSRCLQFQPGCTGAAGTVPLPHPHLRVSALACIDTSVLIHMNDRFVWSLSQVRITMSHLIGQRPGSTKRPGLAHVATLISLL